jgi:hypothetical protein
MKKGKIIFGNLRLGMTMLIFLWSIQGALYAQNVTISPQSGHVIAALTNDEEEEGFTAGYGSMWIHNQLPLVFSTSDHPMWSPEGVLLKHTCVLGQYKGHLIHATGFYPAYSTIALPKGYRIKSYRIVIVNNLNNDNDHEVLNDVWDMDFARIKDWTFGEIDRDHLPKDAVEVSPVFRDDKRTRAVIPTDSYGQEFTIERSGDDIGNILYFAFDGNTGVSPGYLAAFTFKSIEITFAADNTFDVPLSPQRNLANQKVSLTNNYFATQRIDIGGLAPHEKNGKTYFSYNQDNVKEMKASVKLYEEHAVSDGTWYEPNGQPLISSVLNQDKRWYSLRSGTYYIESPTSVEATAANKTLVPTPIGYRIVGAKFNYSYGKEEQATAGFYIKYTERGTTWYLDRNAEWTNDKTVWHMEGSNNIYTMINGHKAYLDWGFEQDFWGNRTYFPVVTNTANERYYDNIDWWFDQDGDLGCDFVDGNSRYSFYLVGGWPQGEFAGTRETLNDNEFYCQKEDIVFTTFTPTDFKLTIYGKDGSAVAQTINVTAADVGTDNVYELKGLNNDAVKFEIETDRAGADALVDITLQLQPLNPFIHSVDVVCKDEHGAEMTRTFTSQDFKLGGDVFVYKVPTGFTTNSAQFTFRNLKSNYADNTYLNHPGDGYSRYSFVASEYYNKVNDDLYGNSATVANYDYTKKIEVNKVGNIPFAFNNAADLDNTQQTTETKYLIERPFSMAKYNESIVNGQQGSFNTDNAMVQDGEERVLYLFTTDETRYNIAPTTKEMHRWFAFYHTTIKLELSDYVPQVEWKPVYDRTFYLKDGQEVNTPMVGAVLTTTEAGFDQSDYGYLTVAQIKQAMETSIAKGSAQNVPLSLDQVLYVDNSNLFSVISRDDNIDETPMSLSKLRDGLAKNAIVYLPARTANASGMTNMAVKESEDAGFTADADFVIEDKQPFFAPYEIRLSDNHSATYTRQITTGNYENGKTYTTLALPFGVAIDEQGTHDDAANDKLTFYELKADNSFVAAPDVSGTDYRAEGVFVATQPDESGRSLANRPYMVMISQQDQSADGLYTISQTGAVIKATPAVISGQISNGAWEGTPLTLTSGSTFAGATFDKADKPSLFYFSVDKFVALANLRKNTLKVFPFRAFYDFENTGTPTKMFTSFVPRFDDNSGGVTNIDRISEESGINLFTDKGFITVQTSDNREVTIHALSGQTICRLRMSAGQTERVAVPAGIYIVNGIKIIVK